jgi:hypothetical protein
MVSEIRDIILGQEIAAPSVPPGGLETGNGGTEGAHGLHREPHKEEAGQQG